MNELHLFAGAGGGILGGMLLGHTPVCAVEIEPYCRKVLLQRQRDGILPKFPIWDDVCTFDGTPWRGKVDVICGGFPCQDISAAGKGAGIEGQRSGLWKEMARIIGEIRPRYVFIENSPLLRTRGLSVVLKDLAEMGYDARWGVLGAVDIGAPHKRDRIWIVGNVADFMCNRSQRVGKDWKSSGQAGLCSRKGGYEEQGLHMAYTNNERNVRRFGRMGATQSQHDHRGSEVDGSGEWWSIEPRLGRVANGVANRVDRLKAIGNGQVSAVAAKAFKILKEGLI
jgi:DNA (cytosine-5)-methyltransferase 1